MDPRRKLGNHGEDLTAAFLKERGFLIIDRQVRTRYGEIDIIAEKGEQLVFVEVKTRQTESFGRPEESVTSRKLEKMSQAIDLISQERGWTDRSMRIDVVAVIIGANQTKIDHFKDVNID